MVNDLLFPILPRDGRVRVKFDNRVEKIGKITSIKALGEQERMEHDEERRVSGEQEREQHQRAGHDKGEQSEGEHYPPGGHPHKDSTVSVSGNYRSDEESATDQNDTAKIKHLDIYI